MPIYHSILMRVQLSEKNPASEQKVGDYSDVAHEILDIY